MAKNLRDKGYSSSTDNYYQQQKLHNPAFQISASSYGWIYHSICAIAKIRSRSACILRSPHQRMRTALNGWWKRRWK